MRQARRYHPVLYGTGPSNANRREEVVFTPNESFFLKMAD
jgi:hypothetical protein